MSSGARPPIFRMAREDVWEFPRPNMDLVPELIKYSAATVAVVARNVVGTPSTFFNGVAPLFRGKGHDILGPAITLQYAPQRPDLMPTGEYAKVEDQNHRIAVNITQEGYVLVVQADGNTRSGVLGGNMMLALQHNRKAAGLVVHGVVRDYGEISQQNFPIWTQDARTTTDYDAQHDLAPLAVNVRISVAGHTVMPGDWIRADDDGVCYFPGDKIEDVLDGCNKHWWEPAARHFLMEGGHLTDCYPMPEHRWAEAAAWQRANGHYVPDDIG